MIAPLILARIEQQHDIARAGINTREVRSLVCVTAVTGEGELARIVSAAMLPGGDMFNMEGNQGRRFLRDAAVLAGVAGAPAASFSW